MLFHSTRMTAAAVAAAAALFGWALMPIPAANAAGGCSGVFDNVKACIQSSGSDIDSYAYLYDNPLPPGCTFSISLYKVINGQGNLEFSSGYPCRYGKVGDLLTPIALVGHGQFYNVSCVDSRNGGACNYSPIVNF